MVDISLIFQGLVALTTGLLASATFWLAWNSVQERKTAKARELAIGVYNPLRNDMFRYSESEPGYNYGDHFPETWTSLKRNQLDLVARVPKPITTALDTLEPDVRKANFLKTQVENTVRQLWWRLADGANAGSTVLIRLIVTRGFVRTIDPVIVWLSRKSLGNYVNEYSVTNYPKDKWHLEFAVDSNPVGSTQQAEDYSNRFFDELDRNKDANDLRDLLGAIATQGKTINTLIEAELRRH